MASKSKLVVAPLALLLLFSLHLLLLVGVSANHHKVQELTLYVHESRLPRPTATLVTVLTASGNLSELGFGSIQIFSNTLRDGPTNTSAVIGVQPGFVTIGTENVFVNCVFALTTPTYNGTISVQGQLGIFTTGPRELAVVGGTGQFRFVSGYDVNEIVNQSDVADVFVHHIYLKYL